MMAAEVQAVKELTDAQNQHWLPESVEYSKCIGDSIETQDCSVQNEVSYADAEMQHQLPE